MLPLILLAIVFVAVSYLAHRYEPFISALVTNDGALSVVFFILLTATFVIFVIPLDIAFLIPIGAQVWGPLPTAYMSIVGWTIGASVAFAIARRYGTPVVERLIGLERVRMIESRIPQTNLFLMVVFLRMLVSVDILSYALGLFSRMRWSSYILATAIGVSPFGFYFTYAATLPLWYEIGAVVLALLVATLIAWRYSVVREP